MKVIERADGTFHVFNVSMPNSPWFIAVRQLSLKDTDVATLSSPADLNAVVWEGHGNSPHNAINDLVYREKYG